MRRSSLIYPSPNTNIAQHMVHHMASPVWAILDILVIVASVVTVVTLTTVVLMGIYHIHLACKLTSK